MRSLISHWFEKFGDTTRFAARYQAGCCAWSDQLLVVSGCDTWNCINSVECYDSVTNSWRFLPPLSTARRGCGVGVLKGTSLTYTTPNVRKRLCASFLGKLYVFGGSDGVHSLNSTEVLDLADPHATWRPGPSLNSPRGNVRAVVIKTATKDVLFAIGGFNGKSFLNSIEYLEEGKLDQIYEGHGHGAIQGRRCVDIFRR